MTMVLSRHKNLVETGPSIPNQLGNESWETLVVEQIKTW